MIINHLQGTSTFYDVETYQKNDLPVVPDTLWTVEDLAEYLKLQPETIRSMARRGELPAIKLGKVWRFQKTAIYEMLASSR
jgi:excisionase family DNA binding protein